MAAKIHKEKRSKIKELEADILTAQREGDLHREEQGWAKRENEINCARQALADYLDGIVRKK